MSDLIGQDRPGASGRLWAERLARRRHARGDAAPSALERAIAKGNDGEERLGAALNEAAQARGGVAVLHDLVLPGKRANIDHLVVGPAGVTIVDAKAWSGRVWLGRAVIGQGRRAWRKPIGGMHRQLHRVHEVLAPAGRDDVPVDAALCFVDDNAGVPAHRLEEVEGVRVGRARPVIDHAMRDGRFGLEDVIAVAVLLREAFTVRGGVVLPSVARTRSAHAGGEPAVRRVPARWLRGAVTAVLGVALVLLVSATVLALVESAATSLAPRAPLSRAELGGELPHLARLARRHAGTELGAPRIRRHPDRFVLRYRGRGACRVVMSVTRDADATPAPPVVWTTGCG